MPTNSDQIRGGLRGFRAWLLVVVSLGAIVGSMVFVSERARREADTARQVQVIVAQLDTAAQKFKLLSVEGVNKVLAGNETSRAVASRLYGRGKQVWDDMDRSISRLSSLAPGDKAGVVRAQVTDLKAAALRARLNVLAAPSTRGAHEVRSSPTATFCSRLHEARGRH